MLPELFVNRMREMLQGEYEDFRKCYENAEYHSLRINTLKGTVEQYRNNSFFEGPSPIEEQVPWEKNGYYYAEELQPGKHPFHEAGVYYIQEASAMAPASICCQASVRWSGQEEETDKFSSERVLDLCAAPGGKSTQMAAAMNGKGLLVCNEIHPARVKILSENIERMGIKNAIVVNHDPKVLAKRFPGYFHRILVDAPCSGEGMFRKNEEAAAQWSMENVEMCAQRQDEILECAYEMLQPGGVLVYSTCTFAPAENEGSISRLLEKHEDMELLEIKRSGGMESGKPYQIPNPAEQIARTVRLWPHKVRGEGHYVALLQRKGTAIRAKEEEDYRQLRVKREKSRTKEKASEMETFWNKFEQEVICPAWMEQMDGYRLLNFGEQLYLLPKSAPDFKGLKVLRPGLHLGTIKKDRFEPSHALALSLKPENVKESIDLSVEDAIKYIRGYTFSSDKQNGWYLITVCGYSLGWGKVAAGTLKNHYPKGLRKSLMM